MILKMPIDNLLDHKPEVLGAILPLFEHEREQSLIEIKALQNQIIALELEIESRHNAIQRSQDYTKIIQVHLATRTEGFLRREAAKRDDEVSPGSR